MPGLIGAIAMSNDITEGLFSNMKTRLLLAKQSLTAFFVSDRFGRDEDGRCTTADSHS